MLVDESKTQVGTVPVQPPGPVLLAPVCELPRSELLSLGALDSEALGDGEDDGVGVGEAEGLGVGGWLRSLSLLVGAGLSDGEDVGLGETLPLGVGVGLEVASRSASAIPAGTIRMNRNDAITTAEINLLLFMDTASLLRLRRAD